MTIPCPIAVVILTLDEEVNLPYALQSGRRLGDHADASGE